MDKTANLISTLQNAQKRQKNTCILPFSLNTQQILSVLLVEGYIKGFHIVQSHSNKNQLKNKNNYTKISEHNIFIEVYLKYLENKENEQCVLQLKRISKPGKRMYTRSKNVNKIQRGLGNLLLSTSKGILTDRDARYLNIGGELLCVLS